MSKNFDIFISYRRKETADKAEHLFSLLEMAGYKEQVSFDRENFDGRFDLEILQRLDNCKDFIVVLAPVQVCKICGSSYRNHFECKILHFVRVLLIEVTKITKTAPFLSLF